MNALLHILVLLVLLAVTATPIHAAFISADHDNSAHDRGGTRAHARHNPCASV